MSSALDDPLRDWPDERLDYQYLGLLNSRRDAKALTRSRVRLQVLRLLIRDFQIEYRRRGRLAPKHTRAEPEAPHAD